MGKHPLFRRALSDTISAQKSVRFMWGGEGVLAVAGGAWLAAYAPIDAPTIEIVARSVFGGLIGLATALLAIFLWNLIRAPVFIKFEKEREPKFIVKGIRSYNDGKGFQWLGLCVENPTTLPIPNCYGKLCSRRHVRLELTKSNGVFIRPELSVKDGKQSEEHIELPPEGHRFPWLPENIAETTITIPGYNGREILYFAAKNVGAESFGFPTELGVKYHNWSLGDFELEIEIGSETLGFQPIRQIVEFRVEAGYLEGISPNTID